jgi:hypothetical protein
MLKDSVKGEGAAGVEANQDSIDAFLQVRFTLCLEKFCKM